MCALLQRPQASDHCNPQPPEFGSARQEGGGEEKGREEPKQKEWRLALPFSVRSKCVEARDGRKSRNSAARWR